VGLTETSLALAGCALVLVVAIVLDRALIAREN
jgi:hypothetical protein